MKIITLVLLIQFLTGCMVKDTFNEIQGDITWKYEKVDHRNEWESAGVNSPKDAKRWMKLGVYSSPCSNSFCETEYVGNWIKRGITNPENAKPWINSSLKNYEKFGYIDAGISVDAAEKWSKLDCGSYGKACIENGLKDPDIALAWFKSGFSKNEIIAYASYGITSLDKAIQWKKYGVEEYQINEWKKSGVSIEAAHKLVTTNAEWDSLDPEYAKAWKKTGYTPEQARPWIDAGVKEAPFWIIAGITNINEAKKWVNAGISDGFDWVIKGISYDDAKRWKTLGVSSWEDAVEIKIDGNLSSSSLLKSCGYIVKRSDLVSTNPYKYVNKCFNGCLKINQIISKSEAFGETATLESMLNPLSTINERKILISAGNDLSDDFVVNNAVCGIFKITNAKQFDLANGRTVTGNSFKRMARF